MQKTIILLSIFFSCICYTTGQNRERYDRYSTIYLFNGDTIGKRFHIIEIPFDTTFYMDGGDAIIDVNGDGLKDNLGRVQQFSLSNTQDIVKQHKSDTINQLCVYINEGDSVFRYKTRSAFVLSDYYMPWYSILPYGNNGFCIKTEGRQLDWNRYYLYFQYDGRTDHFYLVKSLVQAEYENNNKRKIEEKVYNENTRIPFEKVNFDIYFKHLLDAIPRREDWRSVIVEKAIIHNQHFQPTRQYLIKNNDVRIDSENTDFYQITFFSGKITIKGWIKKSDVE
jgi:hypothetical protein